MRVYDNRYAADLRRHDLAVRLIGHGARTETVRRWTGLSKTRVRSLCRSYSAREGESLQYRLRGPAPNSIGKILHSPEVRSEAAVLAGLCRELAVISAERSADPARTLPGLGTGEKLCSAFEVYRLALPFGTLTLEHLICLVTTLSRHEDFEIGHCADCDALILVDRLGNQRLRCALCQSDGTREARNKRLVLPKIEQPTRGSVPKPALAPGYQQLPLLEAPTIASED